MIRTAERRGIEDVQPAVGVRRHNEVPAFVVEGGRRGGERTLAR